MANQEQLALLEDAEAWNQWRAENPRVSIDFSNADLSNADLSGTNLSNADLSNADLSNADLHNANLSGVNLDNADFCGANLSGTNLSAAILSGANLIGFNLGSADLHDANLSDADLSDADLSNATLSGTNLKGANLKGANLSSASLNFADLRNTDFSGANFSGANLSDGIQIDPKWKLVHELVNEGGEDIDLSAADLSNAFLRGANLSYADLSYADLNGANLNGANLSYANLIFANFSNADISGASLVATQARVTNFTGANFTGACLEDWSINSETKLDDVICEYFYWKQNEKERRPSSSSFKSREFSLLLQKALETVDLIFADGIDWKAFFASFQELQAKYGDSDLFIQAIEKKSGGAFVIRLEVSAEADKAEIEQQAKQLYEGQIRQLEERVLEYRGEVGFLRQNLLQSNTNIERIVETMAENQSPKYDFRGSSIGNFVDTAQAGSQQSNVQYINMSQDLAQAAQQIQDLLQQLQNQGINVEESQQQVANDIAKQAETNPTLMGKLVLWGKAMANKASETTVSEAAKIVFTLALKAAGVS